MSSVRGLLYAEVLRTATDDRCVTAQAASGHVVPALCDDAIVDAWEATRDGELRTTTGHCLSAVVANRSVRATSCDGTLAQRWRVTSVGRIVARAGTFLL
ncbi:hypothetical protein P43SY_010384 [Pythium insidiosum]|uniref:Ricin B lectin domain-containing protein n=1 Tax=Pythium insidiosum TaxID=114742 RepID=A0AAD5L7B1_PYTIN|nr:hypothetical protein P43SY_010384 [Pythium insidiosum]